MCSIFYDLFSSTSFTRLGRSSSTIFISLLMLRCLGFVILIELCNLSLLKLHLMLMQTKADIIFMRFFREKKSKVMS